MTNKRIQLSTNVDGQNVNVYPVTKSEFVEFSDGKTLNDKLNNMDGNHEHGLATPAKDGFMSKEDKAKLDGVNNYTHPSTHAATMITEDATHRFVTDAEKTKWDNKADNVMASKTNAGLMSASDKQRIDGLNAEFKTRDDKITKNTEDIKSWNDEMINKEYQYFNGENITIENSIISKTTDMIIKGSTLQNILSPSRYKLNYNGGLDNGKFEVVNSDINKVIINIKEVPTSWCYLECGEINKAMFKANTKYTIIGDFENAERIILADGTGQHSITNLVTINNNMAVLQTKSLEEINKIPNNIRILVYCYFLKKIGTVSAKNIMILEGDWTNKVIPSYFEGIKSFGQQENKISILSNGKNIFNAELEVGNIAGSGSVIEGQNINSNMDYARTKLGVKCKPNTSYVVSLEKNDIYEFEKTGVLNVSDGSKGKWIIFLNNKGATTSENIYFKCVVRRKDRALMTSDEIKNIKIQLEEGTQATNYEDYKENKKDILIKEPLRSVSDVKDIMYEDNGKVKIDRKCIMINVENKEIIPHGSANDREFKVNFKIDISDIPIYSNSKIICNNFKNITSTEEYEDNKIEGVTLFSENRNNIYVSILKSKLTTPDVEGFKKWLKDNPTEIIYQLATPTVEIVENCVDINLKTFNERSYVTSDNVIKGELSFTAPMNTAANLENNSNRLNDIEEYIDNNKNNIDKISKLEEGSVTSSLNIIDLQKEIKSENNYTHYEGTKITINNLSKNSRTSNMLIKGQTLQNLWGKATTFTKTYQHEFDIQKTDNGWKLTKGNTNINGYFNPIPDNLLKTNTTYTLILRNNIGNIFYSLNGTYTTDPFPSVGTRDNVIKFTTKNSINEIYLYVSSEDNSITISNEILLLEGDWTNKELPLNYFEVIQSVGELEQNKIKIISHGKNLLNPDLIKANSENVSNFKNTNGIISGSIDTQYKGTIEVPIGVKGKKKVLIKGLFKACRLIIGNCWLDDGSYRAIIDTNNWNNNLDSFEIGSRIVYIDSNSTMRIENPRNASVDFIAKDLCCYVIDGSENDPYEPYKEDTTTIQLKAPLRENDYLYEDNNQVKVYREKNKYVITGDENWTGFKIEESGLARMILDIPDIKSDSKLISNIPVVDFPGSWTNRFECITELPSNKSVLVYLKNCSDATAFKNKLKQLKLNNSAIELVYELDTPIIEKIDNCLDLNLEVFKNKTYISSDNIIQGEINFNVTNNLNTQVKDNTSFINKASKAINQINNKSSKIEAAQLSTALNVLELQKHTAMLNNGEINEYKNHIGTFIECNNTLDSRTENMIIKGKTYQNLVIMSKIRIESKWFRTDSFFINPEGSNIFTAINLTTKPIRVQTSKLNNDYGRGFTLMPKEKKIITLNNDEKLRDVLGVIEDGWTLDNAFHLEEIKKGCIILLGNHEDFNSSYFEGIKSIGEAECNILDEKQILPGYIGGTDGVTLNLNPDEGARVIIIPCDPNTAYTITKEYLTDRFIVGTASNNPVNGTKITKLFQSANVKSATIVTPSDAKYLLAYITLNIKLQPYGKININKSFYSTNWSIPGKYRVDIISHGKNLIKLNSLDDWDGGSLKQSFECNNGEFNYHIGDNDKVGWAIEKTINVRKGVPLTLSLEAKTTFSQGGSSWTGIYYRIGSSWSYFGNYMTPNSNYKKFEFKGTVPVAAEECVLRIYNYSEKAGTSYFRNIQVELGDTSTEYESLKYNKQCLLIKEPLREWDNIYENNGKIKIDRHTSVINFNDLIINISEISERPNAHSTNWFQTNFIPQLKNAKKSTLNLNNKYVGVDAEIALKDTNDFECLSIAVQENGVRLQGRVKKGVSIEQLNERLKGLVIYYQLSLPVVENIDSIDINVDTYKDKTYITTDNKIQGELEFKTQNNFGAIMKNVNRCISKIFNSLNNILNIKGE